MINGLLAILTGVIVLFPFLVTVVFLVVMRKRGRAPASEVGRAADWTTPFLFFSVYFTSEAIFHVNTAFIIIVISIIIALLFATNERLKEKEFQMTRFFHKTWRTYFLVLGVAYIVLMIIGIVLKIVQYVK